MKIFYINICVGWPTIFISFYDHVNVYTKSACFQVTCNIFNDPLSLRD